MEAKTSLIKWIHAVSKFVAPWSLLYSMFKLLNESKMLVTFSGVKFQKTVFQFKKIVVSCSRPPWKWNQAVSLRVPVTTEKWNVQKAVMHGESFA